MPTFNQLIRHGREEKRRTDRTRASDQCIMNRNLVSIVFLIHLYGLFYYLPTLIPPLKSDVLGLIKNLPMNMGGACAIYFLFAAKTNFSKRFTLLSFFLSTLTLFEIHHAHDHDIGLMIMIVSTCSFYFTFYFISDEVDIEKNYLVFFFLIFIGRVFISPEIAQWEITFIIQLMMLWAFSFFQGREKFVEKKGILLSLILLLIVLLSNIYSYNSHPHGISTYSLMVLVVLSVAAAGAIQFLFLSTAASFWPFSVYFLSNVWLGFILTKQEGTFPRITVYFLYFNCAFLMGFWMIAFIQSERLSHVISKSRPYLPTVYFPLLFLLHWIFLWNNVEDVWIQSLNTQVLLYQLLTFILQKENPHRKNE